MRPSDKLIEEIFGFGVKWTLDLLQKQGYIGTDKFVYEYKVAIDNMTTEHADLSCEGYIISEEQFIERCAKAANMTKDELLESIKDK